MPFIVVAGSPSAGFQFFGPFTDRQNALDYIDEIGPGAWLAEVRPPLAANADD